jgi:2'-5' RNA ligase
MQYLIAIEPPIPMVEKLLLLQEELEAPLRHFGVDVRPTAPEQFRLNLRRLDSDVALDLTRVRDGLRTIAANTRGVTFGLRGARVLPEPGAPRLLVADAVDADRVLELRRKILVLTEQCGLPAELAPWEPCVGVTRLSTPDSAVDLSPVFSRYAESDWGRGEVRELVLLRADHRVRAGRPQIVDRFEFGSGR